MKSGLESPRLDASTGSAIAFRRDESSFPFNWHHHAEFELTMISKGAGVRWVGDQKRRYGTGDFVLLGSHLPHTWASDESCGTNSAIVVQFSAACFPPELLARPEFSGIARLLDASGRGISFEGDPRVRKKMERLPGLMGLELWKSLLEVLESCCELRGERLATASYRNSRAVKANDLLARIFRCIDENPGEPVGLNDAARTCGLSSSAFSRWVKKLTGKSYVRLRQERRLKLAERLLEESRRSIAEVAMEAGFGNLSHFHRCFMEHHKTTPLAWRVRSEKDRA